MKKQIGLVFLVAVLAVSAVGCAQTEVSASKGTQIVQIQEEGITDYSSAKVLDLNSGSQNITQGGKYILTGSLQGQVIVNTKKDVYIQLAGVDIDGGNAPGIEVQDAGKIVVTLKQDTTNKVVSEASSDLNAAIFSNDTIEFEGSGKLEVSNLSGNGIESDDDIIINGGNLLISAGSDGITVKDNITINGGSIEITKAEEGIESKGDMVINGGKINIVSNDDGLNAATLITINDGAININANTGDAIDSNGDIIINGGYITAFGGRAPEGGIDIDRGNFEINGGTVIALAGTNAKPSDTSKQTTILAGVTGVQGTVQIMDAANTILEFEAPKAFSSILISTPDMKIGSTYTIKQNETQLISLETSSVVTVQGGAFGGAGMGGGTRPDKKPDFTKVPSSEIAPPPE